MATTKDTIAAAEMIAAALNAIAEQLGRIVDRLPEPVVQAAPEPEPAPVSAAEPVSAPEPAQEAPLAPAAPAAPAKAAPTTKQAAPKAQPEANAYAVGDRVRFRGYDPGTCDDPVLAAGSVVIVEAVKDDGSYNVHAEGDPTKVDNVYTTELGAINDHSLPARQVG